MAEFDPLCEVQSDKATVEITSQYAGRIARLRHAEGDMVQVCHAPGRLHCMHSHCQTACCQGAGGRGMLQLCPTPLESYQVGDALLEMDTGAQDGAEAADSGLEPAASSSHPAGEESESYCSHELQVGSCMQCKCWELLLTCEPWLAR